MDKTGEMPRNTADISLPRVEAAGTINWQEHLNCHLDEFLEVELETILKVRNCGKSHLWSEVTLLLGLHSGLHHIQEKFITCQVKKKGKTLKYRVCFPWAFGGSEGKEFICNAAGPWL